MKIFCLYRYNNMKWYACRRVDLCYYYYFVYVLRQLITQKWKTRKKIKRMSYVFNISLRICGWERLILIVTTTHNLRLIGYQFGRIHITLSSLLHQLTSCACVVKTETCLIVVTTISCFIFIFSSDFYGFCF